MADETMKVDGIDLDNIDMDNMDDLDNLDLESFGEVNETIEFPHIKMSSKELKTFLTQAKLVSVASGKDFVTKSVAFVVEGEKIKARSTDIDVYIEKEFECLNSENVLTEPVIIPIDSLIKLSQAVPVNTIFFKDEVGYKIRLVGGDMPLETFNVDIEKFKFKDEVTKVGTIESKDLAVVLRDFSGIMTQAISPQEKRILFLEDRAYVSYMWSAVSSKLPFTVMDVKSKDVSILRSLTAQKEEALTVYDTAESVKVKRKVIEGAGFKYAFLVSDVKVPEAVKTMLNKVDAENGVYVDFVQLYKMAQLMAEYSSSLGKIGFNYNETGDVIMSMKMKNSKGKDTIFTLPGQVEGTVKPLSTEIVVQAKMLRIILRSFAQFNSVKLSVNAEGLGISCESYSAAVMIEQGK